MKEVNVKISKGKLSKTCEKIKLVLTHTKFDVVHIQNLKFYEEMGLEITKVHKVLVFK